MASRVAEVIYRLKDVFTAPARRIVNGYRGIRDASKRTADSVVRDSKRQVSGLASVRNGVASIVPQFRALAVAIGAAGITRSFKQVVDQPFPFER